MADEDGDDADINPFDGFPMFGDISRMLSGQGPLNWDAARQFAIMSASGADGIAGAGSPPTASPNIDPAVRIKYGELANIARLHVADVMDIDVPGVEPSVATPEQWAAQTLEAYRPLFTELASSLGPGDDDPGSDPMAQMMAGLAKMMAPAMLGMAVGSMVGNLARGAFGVYDLPIPRATPTLVMVPPTIDIFAAEWEIDLDEMRLWVLAHELAGLALFSVSHFADHLRGLVQRHVGAFEPDPSAVTEKLSTMETDQSDPLAAMQQALGDPEVLLGAVRSDEQLEMEPVLDAAVCNGHRCHRLGGRRCRRPHHRWQRPTDRRGSTAPPSRNLARGLVRRTPPRNPTWRRANRSGQDLRAGCRRSRRRNRTGAVVQGSRGHSDSERD